MKAAKANKSFLQAISRNNHKIKIDIANLKNTNCNLNRADFKNKLIK